MHSVNGLANFIRHLLGRNPFDPNDVDVRVAIDSLESDLAVLPIPSDDYSTVKNRLEAVRQYCRSHEVGAMRWELKYLLNGLKSKSWTTHNVDGLANIIQHLLGRNPFDPNDVDVRVAIDSLESDLAVLPIPSDDYSTVKNRLEAVRQYCRSHEVGAMRWELKYLLNGLKSKGWIF